MSDNLITQPLHFFSPGEGGMFSSDDLDTDDDDDDDDNDTGDEIETGRTGGGKLADAGARGGKSAKRPSGPVVNRYLPTDPFTTLKLQNPPHDVPEPHEFRLSPDLEALKL